MKNSRIALVVLAANFAAFGFISAILSRQTDALMNVKVLEIAVSVVHIIAVYVWCRAEASERGSFPPGRSAMWAALLSLVFVPVYFFRTRPIRLAINASFKALGFYCLIVIGLLLSALIAQVVVIRS